jgi:hypothetical protein
MGARMSMSKAYMVTRTRFGSTAYVVYRVLEHGDFPDSHSQWEDVGGEWWGRMAFQNIPAALIALPFPIVRTAAVDAWHSGLSDEIRRIASAVYPESALGMMYDGNLVVTLAEGDTIEDDARYVIVESRPSFEWPRHLGKLWHELPNAEEDLRTKQAEYGGLRWELLTLDRGWRVAGFAI